MAKFIAALRMFIAIILVALALATLVNLLFIVTRPETISVVNAMIGQGVIIICFLALARFQFRKGLSQWRALHALESEEG